MAYITTSNSKGIIRKINFNSAHFEGNIYKNPIYYFFSKFEEQSLLAIQELLKNPESFFNEYYEILNRTDSYQYVFENITPAYHKSFNCPRLHSSFQNFKIPDEIKDRGVEEILKYRKWFKDLEYLLVDGDEIKIEAFKERCRLRFRLSLPPEVIIRKNSGSFEIDDVDLNSIEHKIDDLLKSAGNFYFLSKKHSIIIQRFSKLTFLANRSNPINENTTEYTDIEVKELLAQYATEFKYPLMHLLREWYRIKYNPELKFEGKRLQQLGFKPCGTCFNHSFTVGINTENREVVCVRNELDDIINDVGNERNIIFKTKSVIENISEDVNSQFNRSSNDDLDWERLDDSPYYNWDLDMDQQSPDFWDSL